MEVGHAMWVALYEREKKQVEQVLESLGCDPSAPDWESAFFKMARLYCNVGQIRRARGGSSGTKWTLEHEFILIAEVGRLIREGISDSDRAAIKRIANDPAYDNVFPYEERVDDIRVMSRRRVVHETDVRKISRQRREEALRRRFESIKQRSKSDPKGLERVRGLNIPDSMMRIITMLHFPAAQGRLALARPHAARFNVGVFNHGAEEIQLDKPIRAEGVV
jgi:hypothetical protein